VDPSLRPAVPPEDPGPVAPGPRSEATKEGDAPDPSGAEAGAGLTVSGTDGPSDAPTSDSDVLEIGPRRRPAGRLAPLWRLPAAAGRGVARWSARPAGRLVLPGLLIALLIGVTGTAGGYLIPAIADPVRAPEPSGTPAGNAGATTAAPDPGGAPTAFPTAELTGVPVAGREAAKLAPWALPLSVKVQIPQTALEAYGYAQWVVEQTQPNCRLSWTTLAAIGKVESNHGRANGATLTADGRAFPPIIGDPLDGQAGRRLIRDTDSGSLDNDGIYDRAVGPMQFIPGTWRSWAMDADSNGMTDPNDLDDAALSAAKYLCANGRDLSAATGWWEAVLSYNNLQSYANAVFDAANAYGQQSRNTP